MLFPLFSITNALLKNQIEETSQQQSDQSFGREMAGEQGDMQPGSKRYRADG